MKIGMIGLGRMGMNMARRLLRGGHQVVAYNRTPEKTRTLVDEEGAEGIFDLEDFSKALTPPRLVWMMLPAGPPVDEQIGKLVSVLERGDIIIDGGNTYYRDDLRREESLRKKGIGFVDVGVSGGVWGLKEGYCLMVGGKREHFDILEPVFETLAPPGGYLYCGGTGSGHFIKMIHNGIEYAMMEAYAEGFELLEASPYGSGVEYSALARLWNRGSVIRSWLLELLEVAFKKDPSLGSIAPYVEDSGEGRWTVEEAVQLSVPVPAISASLFRRFRSREQNSFGERLIAALRAEFGGHSIKRK
ncbi:MAG: decarboxylating 6-phosphogluconate dehydrogenase [Nitrospirae bacterium]|nr:MAG: decarboxylating 6-phosphogluconate dehydrogenase [Nitrospirota bacterium]